MASAPFEGTIPHAARKAAVLGDPVSHSRSPALHGFWLAEHGIDGAYVPLRVEAGRLPKALQTLQAQGFAGCNLTIPHKEAALPLMDALDDAARAIGAVNTVVFKDGQMFGRNTDAEGFMENLREGVGGEAPLAPFLECVLILGAGGAARAAIHGLLEAGARKVILVNRSLSRAQNLAREFGPRLQAAAWEDLPEFLPTATLVANATSLGMQGQPELVLPWSSLPRAALVTDMVYAPLETELLRRARALGCRTIDGLGMLLHQARPGFEAWFGLRPAVTPALRAAVLA